jgi:uncharacterized protein YndB with AHSA1/START domain
MGADLPVQVRVTHRYAATPERVFDAWLDPAIARRFLFATAEGEVVRAQIDPRIGGRFVIVDRRTFGDASHFGQYIEIDRPRALAFTFALEEEARDRDRVRIEIVAAGRGAELTLTHELDVKFAQHVDRVRDGWTAILERLADAIR